MKKKHAKRAMLRVGAEGGHYKEKKKDFKKLIVKCKKKGKMYKGGFKVKVFFIKGC